MPEMHSRFDSRCVSCHDPIDPGDRILFFPERGAYCLECATPFVRAEEAAYMAKSRAEARRRASEGSRKYYHYSTASSSPQLSEQYQQLYLSTSAPATVVKAAYRALAKEAHPDVGGSAERMKQLNAAYDAIMAKLEGKGRS